MELLVKFTNNADFEKAQSWFSYESESAFVAETENEEFKSLGFTVVSEEDANNLELAIKEELQETNIANYFFELE